MSNSYSKTRILVECALMVALSTVQDEFCFLLHGTFAVIVKLGRQAQVFVLLLFNLFIGLFQFLGELFFFCQGSFVFL